MSDITNTVFATGAIVVVGRWASNETINVKVVTGGLFLALGLSTLAIANENFARLFADFLLVAAIFSYGLPIAALVGVTTGGIKPPAKTVTT